MVAWDPNGKQAVKNVLFQAYATTDTGFTTPLTITDPFGNPIPGNLLNSGSQGVFPQFQQAQYSTVVLSDAAHTYAWTVPSTQAGAVFAWSANTVYAVGAPVINPSGDLVKCSIAHTSTSSYDATKFTTAYDSAVQNLVNTPTSATAGALAGMYAQVVVPSGLVGGTDCTTAIQNAATKAQSNGVPLVLPASANGQPYKMSAILQAWTGARIIGQGAVLDFQTDHSATGRGLFIGNASTGIGVSDVQVIGVKVISSNATGRNGAYGLISLFGSSNVVLQDCTVGNSTANTGGESVGIFTQNSTNVYIARPIVQNTYADGIHMTRQTTNTIVDHPIVIGAQDDGISVTSVKQDGAGPIYGPCQYVQIIQPTVRNSTVLGSGVVLVGAQDCTVIGGSVDTVPGQVFAVLQANYGGIINPARNTIIGMVGKNAANTSRSFSIGNADRTVVTGVEISQCPGGAQVLSSTRTKISGCGISSTADQFGVYDDGNSSRTLITGCDLSANGAQSYNVYIGTAAGAENTKLANIPMGTTTYTATTTTGTAATVPASNTSGLNAPTANTPTTATTGGSIAAGTYYLKVTAVNSKGETVGSNEVSVTTTGTTSTITITWGAVINAYLLQGAGSVQTANITA
jgi:hypothetical protein